MFYFAQVITNKQEVHKIPEMAGRTSKLGSNSTFSEIKEVNELSLAELIPVNETIIKTNGTDRQKVYFFTAYPCLLKKFF